MFLKNLIMSSIRCIFMLLGPKLLFVAMTCGLKCFRLMDRAHYWFQRLPNPLRMVSDIVSRTLTKLDFFQFQCLQITTKLIYDLVVIFLLASLFEGIADSLLVLLQFISQLIAHDSILINFFWCS